VERLTFADGIKGSEDALPFRAYFQRPGSIVDSILVFITAIFLTAALEKDVSLVAALLASMILISAILLIAMIAGVSLFAAICERIILLNQERAP